MENLLFVRKEETSINKPEQCHVCGYGITFTIVDNRTSKYIHDCPWCDHLALTDVNHKHEDNFHLPVNFYH